ncbi:hypothetical protein GCM10011504_54280 [Siccirubricoccus deserti]|nr:hypothetical protein GCM10011504_54280 [Siccirubricoccus deserti]
MGSLRSPLTAARSGRFGQARLYSYAPPLHGIPSCIVCVSMCAAVHKDAQVGSVAGNQSGTRRFIRPQMRLAQDRGLPASRPRPNDSGAPPREPSGGTPERCCLSQQNAAEPLRLRLSRVVVP